MLSVKRPHDLARRGWADHFGECSGALPGVQLRCSTPRVTEAIHLLGDEIQRIVRHFTRGLVPKTPNQIPHQRVRRALRVLHIAGKMRVIIRLQLIC